MSDPTILALLPPVVALAAALITRHVVLSLALGASSGFVLAEGGNPYLGIVRFLEDGLFKQLADESHAALLILILIIGGFVGLLEQSRGMVTFARRIAGWVRGAVGAQLAVWVGGLVIFFSDSATPLILGPIFRPVLKRLGVSAEKLAYIVDSTASPVCILVPFISWGVYVMSLIDQSYRHLGIAGESFDVFLSLLPYQYYPVLALLAVVLIVLSGRDFGPMARAQQSMSTAPEEAAPEDEPEPPPLRVIVAPLLALVVAVGALFAASFLSSGQLSGEGIKTSLTLAYLVGTAVAIAVLWKSGVMAPKQAAAGFRRGVEKMLIIPLILLLAWSLGHTCQLVGTGRFLAALADQFLTPHMLPSALFVLGAIISFSMGSAWGTFAILMPIAITVAHGMGVSPVVPIAAVLSGGLFGDHGSPISDTTILASMGSGCKHIEHVRTQLPYALLPAAIALLAFGVATVWQSPWVLVVSVALLGVAIFSINRRFGHRTGLPGTRRGD